MKGPGNPEKEQQEPVKVFKFAQEAIDAVKKNDAVAVWKDSYMDQLHPNYLTFFDIFHHSQFEGILKRFEDAQDPDERRALYIELNKLAGSNIEPQSLYWLYKDGKWAYPPQEILQDEDDQQTQDEDDEWFSSQREAFEERENPTPKDDANALWREELQKKALEIAAKDGRTGNPEEADFNTAILIMGNRVPKHIRDDLNKHLKAVEEGRPYSSE